MVTIAIRNVDDSLLPITQWSDDQIGFARAAAKGALHGVGDKLTDKEEGGISVFAIRRLCRPIERHHVNEEFLHKSIIF